MSAVVVPTEYARRLYARRLGLDCTHIPLPLNPRRVVATEPEPRYVTFVNPQVLKGAAVVARIAKELGRRRPEIPFLIVEGRAGADDLGKLELDLSDLGNLNRMANTPDPRDFYRVSRIMLVPSLIENAALVAREALANGIPVLASDRGGLPETLGDAGFVFTLPDRLFAPGSRAVPTARGSPLGGDDRAALGRPGVRSQASCPGEGGSRAVGRRPAGRTIREALRERRSRTKVRDSSWRLPDGASIRLTSKA